MEDEQQWQLWHSFENNILNNNRYFCNDPEFLKTLDLAMENSQIQIDKDTVLFRARIFTDDTSFVNDYKKARFKSKEYEAESKEITASEILRDAWTKANLKSREESGFWGYNKINSSAPPDAKCIPDGRANPARIKYLYLASEPYGALAEVRPLISDHISVAEVECTEELKLVDFSFDSLMKNKEIEMFFYLLADSYSKPNNDDRFKYIPTQYISEYVKSKGYDGIKYSSSLYRRGRNFVIFNCDKCAPISSKLYILDDICYDAEGEAPAAVLHGDPTYDLCSWRLEGEKKQRYERILRSIFGDKIEHDEELKRLFNIQ